MAARAFSRCNKAQWFNPRVHRRATWGISGVNIPMSWVPKPRRISGIRMQEFDREMSNKRRFSENLPQDCFGSWNNIFK